MFFNIKYRMYFKNTVVAMNGLNIHAHVLSCATVQNLRKVKICRQLTKRAYPVS